MATTRLTKETLYLRRDFTADERLEMGRELAQGHNRLAAIDDEEKSMKATVKEKRTGVELMIGSLSRKLNDGYEMENQLCMLTYDQPNVGEVTYTDPSGKVVKTRPMTISERQEELPFEDKVEVIPPAVAEASAEASAENIDEFFKPGRPTEQPTAETAAPVVEEPAGIPSAEDLDAVAEEQDAAEATAEVPERMSSWDALCPGCVDHRPDDRAKLISRDGSKLKVVKPKKSGPKELAAEHAKQLAQDSKKPETRVPVEEGW